jgi:hypothetical protein
MRPVRADRYHEQGAVLTTTVVLITAPSPDMAPGARRP